jgi:penicillin-binding protein 1C
MTTRHLRRALRIVAAGCAAAVVLVALRLWPAAPLAEQLPTSTAFHAQGGELLRLTLARDDQYRLWVPLEHIAPALPQAVLTYEDRWFYFHPGVNPAALLRSALSTFSGGPREGGSTITMQLARRLYRVDSGTLRGKLRQIAAAMWLEARYSKHDLLEAYLNVAPYGGNIDGAGAASLIYFHKRARDLTLPEALALAVIPQNPHRRVPGGKGGDDPSMGAALSAARERLWQTWLHEHPQDARYASDLRLPLRIHTTAELPMLAPHLTDRMLAAHVSGDVQTTIDLRIQQTVERMLQQDVEARRGVGIRNAAAMLVDAPTMRVLASVGSVNWRDPFIDGQVNGTLAKRSPGSALKPFIYALALDQGVLHPLTMLKDAPIAFGPFSPENFDGRFEGPISAQDALVRSRNVPAVAVAARLNRPDFYDFLASAGVSRMASEGHYGLALALGGGEVTMEELTRLYALLANRGVLRDLVYVAPAVPPENHADDPTRLLSEEATYITIDMLRRNPRPDTGAPAQPAVAWKTGTSWGFHDAWTAGVFGRTVLIVWVGNFDGTDNPAFVGVKAAAPMFFHIVDSLRAQHLDPGATAQRMPPKLARVQVCAASGDLPNADCPDLATTWFIPGTSPIRVSRLHRGLLIDQRTGEAVCAENAYTRREVFEFWPSDIQRLFREAGIPRRTPPAVPDCAQEGSARPAATDAPQIVSPLQGVTYTIRLSKPEPIALRANRNGGGTVYWFADQGYLGKAEDAGALAWNAPGAGRYVVRAVDANGASDSRAVTVEFVP